MPKECAVCKHPATVLARLHKSEKTVVVPLCQQCLIRLSQKTRVEILETFPSQVPEEDKYIDKETIQPLPVKRKSKKPLLIIVVALLLFAVITCSALFAIPLIKKAFQKESLSKSDSSETVAGTSMTPEQIYEYASPATVEITAIGGEYTSTGTGFFCNTDKYLITNYHVVEAASEAYITIHDGGRYDITGFYGYDEARDIALLTTTYTPTTVLKSCTDEIQTGESVYVIGSSEGLTASFSSGIVSNSQRNFDGLDFIQITAPISHGNSGGPVLNSSGEVIGISTAFIEEGQNLNFAIPIISLQNIEKPTDNTLYSGLLPNGFSTPNYDSFVHSYSQLLDFIKYYGKREDTEIELANFHVIDYTYEYKPDSSVLPIALTLHVYDDNTSRIDISLADFSGTEYTVLMTISPDLYPKCELLLAFFSSADIVYMARDYIYELSTFSSSNNSIRFEIQETLSGEWLSGQAKNRYSEAFNKQLSFFMSSFQTFCDFASDETNGFDITYYGFGFR